MADYVLDTHACVFALTAQKKLGREAYAALKRVEAGRERAWIPAAVVAEIALLRDLGRVPIGFSDVNNALRVAPSISFLALDLNQLSEFAGLPSIRDPFDRLIVAAARATGARLISKDVALQESGLVSVIWS